MKLSALALVLALFVVPITFVQAQDDVGYAAQREAEMASAVRQLSDSDSLVRQRAAEVLARLSAIEYRRIVDGYRLQEKNDRVRLALDWALYRMGKMDALYGVVRQLRTDSRRQQAVGYLSQLSDPQPLYSFFDRADGKTLIGLLLVMARIGDAESLDLIKSFEGSVEPGVSDTCRFAKKEIEMRLALTEDSVTRPREVESESRPSP